MGFSKALPEPKDAASYWVECGQRENTLADPEVLTRTPHGATPLLIIAPLGHSPPLEKLMADLLDLRYELR